jgi:hypothetical protein
VDEFGSKGKVAREKSKMTQIGEDSVQDTPSAGQEMFSKLCWVIFSKKKTFVGYFVVKITSKYSKIPNVIYCEGMI